MDRRAVEYLARRLENYNRGSRPEDEGDGVNEMENRRRRRSDGTFMRGESEPVIGDEHSRKNNAHYDNESRRRIGFSQGKSEDKSHWSEEEFIGDMEESLYHEVDDIFHYIDIMTKVYHKGYDGLATAFYEIACEKFVCAEFLKGHLKKTGHYNPSEHQQLEEDLKEARKMFKNA